MTPYEELAELAESALPLAEQGKLEDIAAALDRCEALAATLPERPPASALPAIERALAAQDRLRARLGSSLAAVRTELDQVDRGRRTAGAYAGATGSLVDERA